MCRKCAKVGLTFGPKPQCHGCKHGKVLYPKNCSDILIPYFFGQRPKSSSKVLFSPNRPSHESFYHGGQGGLKGGARNLATWAISPILLSFWILTDKCVDLAQFHTIFFAFTLLKATCPQIPYCVHFTLKAHNSTYMFTFL